MKKKWKIVIASIVLAVLIVIGGCTYMYRNGQGPVSSMEEEVVVDISGNDTMVLQQLDEAGLLKNKFVASIYLKLHPHEFKANTYILNKNMNVQEMFDIIESGDTKYLLRTKFTVLEGTSIPQYAKAIGEALDKSEEEILTLWCDQTYLESLVNEYWFLDESILEDGLMFPLEGYLAPETYYVAEKEPSIESVTKLMLDQSDVILSQFKDQIENFTINGEKVTIHEFLSFASVVECETLFEEDRAKIAGVFMHRLETGMNLQSDVTVNYANQVTKVAVTYDDLEVDSKYNTYLYGGLPIGPISSISKDMLEACLEYQEMEELFFFAIKGGEVIYTKTYPEHLQRIQEAKDQGLWLED